jgi:hypothetical protein
MAVVSAAGSMIFFFKYRYKLPSSAECGEGLEPAHSLIPCNVLIKVHLKRQRHQKCVCATLSHRPINWDKTKLRQVISDFYALPLQWYIIFFIFFSTKSKNRERK